MRTDGYRAKDYAKVDEAEDSIDEMLENAKGVDKGDLASARSAWRDSKILDSAHDAVNHAFNIWDEDTANEAEAWRGISGSQLQTGLNRITKKYGAPELRRVLGKDGLTNLTQIADLTRTPQSAAQYGKVVGDVAANLMPKVKGPIGATLDGARRMVLHQAAINPRVNELLSGAVKMGVSPKVYGPLIANTISTFKDAGGQQ